MGDFDYLENYIAEFVDRNVSEKVKLTLKPKSVLIQPVKKKGSILLSMFWIKVLQNKRNFPPQCVSYNKKKVSGSEIIYIFVDDVMVSLDLLSGLLNINGDYAIEWFRTRMLEVIKNYTGVKKSSGDYSIQKSKIRSFVAPTVMSNFYDNTMLENEHLSNLMTETVLESACESVSKSSLKLSKTWIYRFWKSLLYKWLSDSNISVVITTSKIDDTRFRDLADIALLLRATSQIQSLYLPFHCDDSGNHQTLAEIKKSSLESYNAHEQVWIEFEIFNKIIIPKNGVGCNFIAAVLPNNRVQLMLSSCRFHSCDFDIDSLHSVHFLEMSEIQFDKDYVSLLHTNSLY